MRIPRPGDPPYEKPNDYTNTDIFAKDYRNGNHADGHRET